MDLFLIGWTDVTRDQISAKLRLNSQKNPTMINSLFEQLKKDQDIIQTHFGNALLVWDDPPKHSVGVYRYHANLKDVSKHEELFEWLHKNLEKLERVFLWILASYFIESND